MDTILVNVVLIYGSYCSGNSLQFIPNVSSGFKITESPKNLVNLPLVPAGNVQGMHVWLADQNGVQLNLCGQTVTIEFHIRSA